MSILIKNGYCLGEKEGFFDILIEDKRIASIESSIHYRADTIIDAKDSLVMPTFCNAHTHLAMSLFRGMADDLSLMDWLNNHIFPNEARYVNREMVYACSKLSLLEMIRGGTGCFMDMYFFEEEVAKAAMDIGIKGVIGEGIIDFPTPSCKGVSDALSKTRSLKEEFENNNIIVSLAPHSTYTLSLESLRKVADVSSDYRVVQVHAHETDSEIAITIKNQGARPIELLNDVGLLKDNTYLAHCVKCSDNDIDILRKQNSNVINVPQSNLKLASGIADTYKMFDKGINMFIGTDGPASNNNLDIIEELRTMSLIQKVAANNEKAMDAKTTFNIGVNSIFEDSGKLKVGANGDVVIMKLDLLESVPIYDVYSFIAYAANSKAVDTVIINGKVVLKDGGFVDIDEQEVKFKVKEIAKKLGALF